MLDQLGQRLAVVQDVEGSDSGACALSCQKGNGPAGMIFHKDAHCASRSDGLTFEKKTDLGNLLTDPAVGKGFVCDLGNVLKSDSFR